MIGLLALTAKSYVKNYAGLPKNTWQGIVLTGVNALGIGICFFLSLYFVNVRAFSVTGAGILLSLYGLGTVTGGLIAGKLADIFLSHRVVYCSLLLQAFCFYCLTLLTNSFEIAVIMFLLGIGTYGFKTANMVWMMREAGCDSAIRLRIISISHVFSNLGLGLSGVIMGFFADAHFEGIFYFSAGLLGLLSIGVFIFNEKKELDFVEQCESKISNSISQPSYYHLKIILICIFLMGMIIAQLGSTYPLYLQILFPQYGMKAVSSLFLLDTFLIVCFQAPLINYFKKQNKFILAGCGAIFMGWGMMILPIASTFKIAVIACLIWTLGEMLFMATAQVICYEVGGCKVGQSMGVFQATFAASCVIGPTVGSFIYQHAGASALWYVCGIMGMFCFVLCYKERSNAQCKEDRQGFF